MPLTRGCLLAVFRRAPPHLDAVVRVIGHFEVCCPVDDLLERKRPLRAIAAGVGYFSRGKLGRNYPLQLAFHVPDALVLRHRVARRPPNNAIGKSPHDIDCDQQTEIARRSGVILPGSRRPEDRGAVGHSHLTGVLFLILSSVFDRGNTRLHLFGAWCWRPFPPSGWY